MIDNKEMIDLTSKLELWVKKHIDGTKRIYWELDTDTGKYWLYIEYENLDYLLKTYENGTFYYINLKEPTLENFFKMYGGKVMLRPYTLDDVCKFPNDELELEIELSID